MSIIKYADTYFTKQEIYSPDVALSDPIVLDRFTKYAKKLNAISPKSSDFLYFSCIMLHGAEASLVNQKTGEPIFGKNGNPVTAKWDINPKTGSWKWVCSDPNIKPFRNNNGDVFPEIELKKAYRKWVERPLCRDHKSDSVDGVRGLIIDTYWDDKFKRVIGLCALDRKNYQDLARKVEAGYVTDVSMGTAVGRSICYECGNVAKNESEYCQCVRSRRTYGEINIDLSPIELSLVVTGADPHAKVRHIIASLNTYSQQKQERLDELQRAGCVTPGELSNLRNEVELIRKQLNDISTLRASAALDPSQGTNFRSLTDLVNNPNTPQELKDLASKELTKLLGGSTTPNNLASMESSAEDSDNIEGVKVEEAEDNPEGSVEPPYGLAGNKAMTGGRGRSYTEDPESSGPPPWSLDGRETRLASSLDDQILAIQGRLETMQDTLHVMAADIQAAANRTTQKEERNMSDLKERARARREAFQKEAYHQGGGGVNDPQTYPVDPMGDKVKKTEDKQMVGEGMETGSEGLADGDLALKQKLLRAELEERRIRRHALLAQADAPQTVTVGNEKLTLQKTPDGKWSVAQVQKVEDDAPDESALETFAYLQGGGGVNDPQTYPVDPMNDKVKATEDKQMVGEGMEMGNTGLAGGDLALKQKLLRAEFKFSRTSTGEPNRKTAHWDVYASNGPKEAGKLILSATGEEIYGEDLTRDDYWAHLSSADYGRRIIAEIRREGFGKTAYLLTGKVVTAAGPELPGMPAGMPPMATEIPEAKEEKPGAESTKNRVDEALAEVEKALGDLKEVIKESGASEEGGKEELPPLEVSKAALDIQAALDDNGDELAILSEALGKRIEASAFGPEMSELLKIAEESLEASSELRSEATLFVEAKMPEALKKALDKKNKGKKGKKEDEEDEKEEKGKKEKKGKKEDEEDEKEDKGKKGKKDKKEDEDDEKEEKGKKGKKSEAELVLEKMLKARATQRRELVRLALEEEKSEEESEEKEHEIQEEISEEVGDIEGLLKELEQVDEEEGNEASDETMYGDDDPLVAELLADLEKEGPGEELEEEKPVEDMTTLASRKAWREKIAAEVGSKYQLKLEPATDVDTDMLQKAHSGGGYTLSGLDTKPSDEGAKFEGIDEIKSKIMKQVESLPTVREAVSKIGDMLKVGKLSVADLDDAGKLKALAVDPEAAAYWKQYFGEGDPACKEFGQEMSKEFTQKKAAMEAESYKLRLRRATDLALDMQEKGLCSNGRESMNKQIDEIMKFDPAAFEAFKRAMSRVSGTTKTAGKSEPALQVGMSQEIEAVNISDQLTRMWLPKRK